MRRKLFAVAIAAVATLTAAQLWASDDDDKAAAQRIAAALRDSGKMQGYSVGVKCKNGTVWLAGRVTTKEQASTALSLVSNVEGVEQIVNNLTIAPPAAQPAASKRRPVPLGEPIADNGGNQSQIALTNAEQPMPPQQQMRQQPRSAGYKHLPPAQMPYMAQNGPMQQMPMQQGMPPQQGGGIQGRPLPAYAPGQGGPVSRATFDQPNMPNYAWPSYAASPNYAALTYPKQYSASAWPFIGPFYPYPQVPLGWRKVSLEWDDGWWFLDFDDRGCQ